jgi:hypothetical protein
MRNETQRIRIQIVFPAGIHKIVTEIRIKTIKKSFDGEKVE